MTIFIQKIKRNVRRFQPKIRTVDLVELNRNSLINLKKINGEIKIDLVDKNNVEAITPIKSKEAIRAFSQLLEQGHIGMYAYCNQQVVGCLWAYLPTKKKIRMWGGVDVFPGEALLARGYVDAKKRGKGIYAMLIQSISEYIFNEKENIARIIADVENKPALSAFLNCGFKKFGKLTYLYLSKITFFRNFKSVK